MSRDVLPEELTAIDPGAGDKVSIGYDVRWRGIHIYATIGGDNVHWFYDMQSKGFWPMSFGAKNFELAVNFKRISSPTKSGLLAIESDGTANQFDLDSTEAISSHLYYGPVAIGSPHTVGVVSQATAVLGEASGKVGWEIYASDSPQQAYNMTTPSFIGKDWDTQGLNNAQNPLVRGSAMYLKAFDVLNSRWTVEEIPIVVRQAGPRRAL
jgi:hypothetical protein